MHRNKLHKARRLFILLGAAATDNKWGTISTAPIVVCEEGNHVPQKLHALTPDGHLRELAWNNVQLDGQKNGITGDFRGQEWVGPTFSPDGKWLFVNLQRPGITLAITGPWQEFGL